jgi:hypothetical protein
MAAFQTWQHVNAVIAYDDVIVQQCTIPKTLVFSQQIDLLLTETTDLTFKIFKIQHRV